MNNIFDKINNLSVLVIGDIILDKYYYTDVNRISPEAPIPVARFKTENLSLGGAANVAVNVSKLGCKTYLIGQIKNNCIDGENISNLVIEKNISFIPIFTNYQTIVKTRILSQGYQLLRLDFEDENIIIESKIVINEIKKIENKIDLIIVSDYQKGLISNEVIKYIKNLNKYSSIDTKPGFFKDFKGFSLVKPNFIEACGFARSLGNFKNYQNTNDSVEELGIFLKENFNSNFLITRNNQGVTYIGDEISHNKTIISEVLDVTGAGDTCISIFSILDYLKIKKLKNLKIMNAAAKITVSHIGTYSPSINEIKKELMIEIIEKE